MNEKLLYEYRNGIFPNYLKEGNARQHIAVTAQHFCCGIGVDVGAGKWPLPGAIPIELADGGDAMDLPGEDLDYVFSSHCLEHLADPVAALEHWRDKLRHGGVLYLYLPHPDMEYWLPQNCRKHRHSWWPADMADLVRDLGFIDVINSERDMYWSFSVVGFKP